jgi:predicted site-specific integrase-resolvase
MRNNVDATPRLLKEKDVAEILNVEVATLRRWRWAGLGPAYLKLQGVVRYHPEIVAKFVAEGRRTSTSDPGPPRSPHQ